MVRKNFRMLVAAVMVGVSVCGCGSEASESKETEEDITLEELAEEVMSEVPTDAPAEEAEPTEAEAEVAEGEEEVVEEGFVMPEAMPEIVNASWTDGKIQICDRMVDISFKCSNPSKLSQEDMKPEAFAYVEEHKSGTFQELYDWALSYGFISYEEFKMEQLVLNQSSGTAQFYVEKNPYMGNEAIAIYYFNNSGEGKKLGECDAFIYLPGLYDVNKKTGWIDQYTYYPGGIYCEDPYWNYQTVTDYLKENGYEYTEKQSGSQITITMEFADVIECTEFYDKKMLDMKVTFFIDANDTDLLDVTMFTDKTIYL